MSSAWNFECVAYESDHYCVECLPEGVTTEDEFVYPITAVAEVDCYPVCCNCGAEHDYMGLTPEGQRDLSRREWSEKVLARLDDKQTLPAFAWPGGYPIFYVAGDRDAICPDCANDTDKQLSITNYDVHWEGAPMECEECNAQIESAYGDPGAADES